MSNNEPVCECRHGIDVHYTQGCLQFEDKTDYEQCPCKQFTDARLAALWAENAELRDKVCGLEVEVNEGGWMDKYNEKCRRVKELHAEIARLTPRMVREVPQREGWYWFKRDTQTGMEVVEVNKFDGVMCYWNLQSDEWYKAHMIPGWWSAEPIPMPVIEKEG